MSDSTRRDYYALLGLPATATEAHIKRAVRWTLAKIHPDIPTTSATVQDAKVEIFKMINEAGDVLTDAQRKDEYDRHYQVDEIQHRSPLFLFLPKRDLALLGTLVTAEGTQGNREWVVHRRIKTMDGTDKKFVHEEPFYKVIRQDGRTKVLRKDGWPIPVRAKKYMGGLVTIAKKIAAEGTGAVAQLDDVQGVNMYWLDDETNEQEKNRMEESHETDAHVTAVPLVEKLFLKDMREAAELVKSSSEGGAAPTNEGAHIPKVNYGERDV